eukprot:15243917-Heterocapsa_arctica.AAC.1
MCWPIAKIASRHSCRHMPEREGWIDAYRVGQPCCQRASLSLTALHGPCGARDGPCGGGPCRPCGARDGPCGGGPCGPCGRL